MWPYREVAALLGKIMPKAVMGKYMYGLCDPFTKLLLSSPSYGDFRPKVHQALCCLGYITIFMRLGMCFDDCKFNVYNNYKQLPHMFYCIDQ